AAKGVARLSGIPLNHDIRSDNLEQMTDLLVAIVIQENGYNKYEREFVREVIHDTYGADHFAGFDSAQRSAKSMGHEAAGRAGAASDDDAGPRSADRRAEGDTVNRESAVHVDPAVHSHLSGAVSHSSAQ